MLDLREARVKAVAIHKVGNKVKEQGFVAAEELYPMDEQMEGILNDFFLTPFRSEEFFKFAHESDISLNEVYTYAKAIFEHIGTGALLEQSVNILKHLYACSIHPQIKSGELYVAYLQHVTIDEVELDAIGIFKSEHKDTFLHFATEPEQIDMKPEQGVNIKKLDKGCLIFNTFPEDGFSLVMVDRSSEDAQYWRDEFLHVQRLQDNSYQTEAFLDMTRDFCDEVYGKDKDKKDQLVFMNKSINYFSKHDTFDIDEFKEEVVGQTGLLPNFEDYRTEYENEQGLTSDEGFAISKYTVRSKKREFKNVLKLDNQIEIHLKNKDIAESAEYIEKDFDSSRGMYFYKIYFHHEEN